MNAATAPLLRTSERLSFKTCRWRWNEQFNERLRPKTAAPALRLGDLIHQSLAAYYKPGRKRGRKPWVTFEKLYAKELEEQAAIGFRDDDGKWHDALELGLSMLRGYVEEYAAADEDFEVVASEQVFQIPVLSPKTGKPIVNFVGTIDGVWQKITDGSLWFKEFKTAATISTDNLWIDEQAGGYWTYGPDALRERGIIDADDDLLGVLYTFLRKALPDPRPKNEAGQYLNNDGTPSKRQPPAYFHREPVYRDPSDRAELHRRVLNEAREMAMVRDGKLAVYKNPGPAFMPNCRGCPVRDYCELHETDSDWEELRDATMETWDPYGAHEIIERR